MSLKKALYVGLGILLDHQRIEDLSSLLVCAVTEVVHSYIEFKGVINLVQ